MRLKQLFRFFAVVKKNLTSLENMKKKQKKKKMGKK